jgi:hypothetical protein
MTTPITDGISKRRRRRWEILTASFPTRCWSIWSTPTGICGIWAAYWRRAASSSFYTVTPGFPYHRHPVDCMRFFPDWFEEVGKRLDLTVQDRFIGDDHIVYRYLKP